MKVTNAISAILAAVMLLGGCGASDTAKNKGKKELTIFMYDGVGPFKEDFPIYQEAEKNTGIHLTGVISQSTTDPASALNLMMASGDLADIIHTTGRKNFAKYGQEGALVPLNDLIEKHAPEIKKLLDSDESIKDYITAPDGNIYYIPFLPGGEATQGWFIRQDWLDKLGLSVPETVDELYTVLKAFREQDPNGNGEADEMPYFNRNMGAPAEQGIADLLSFWGVNKSFMIKDGQLVYSPLLPEYKEAVKNIAKWYKEGLIDTEIYTRGANARESMLGNNIGGLTHDWFASTAGYNDKLSDTISGFNFVPIAPPAGADGVKREFLKRDKVSEYGWAISSSCEAPEVAMEWMNYWFTEEGNRLMNYGIEGDDYTIIDGKPIFTEKVLNDDLSVAQYLQSRGGQGNVGFKQDFEYEKQWMNKLALAGTEMYINGGFFTEECVLPLLSDEVQSEYDKIMTDVETLRDEKLQKWILGIEDVDSAYDGFVEQIKSMGIMQAVDMLKDNMNK